MTDEASTMDGEQGTRLDPFKLGKRTTELWKQFAKENKDAELLTDMKDTILARLTLKFMEDDPSINRVMAETKALASEEFVTYLKGKAEAREKRLQTQASIHGLDVYCRLGQTADARERVLIQRGIMGS